MKTGNTYSFVVIFIWFGFVCAISFMEAPTKFSAPTLTLPVGLDVGRQVFKMLNRIEVVFGLIVLVGFLLERKTKTIAALTISPLAILLAQTFWLLPVLDARAVKIINGENLESSYFHGFYIFLEGLKVFCLFMLGIFQIKAFKQNIKS